MYIKFENKENIMGNIIYTWSIKSLINNYLILLEFVGGENEDGEEDLTASSFANVRLIEDEHHDEEILNEVQTTLASKIGVTFEDGVSEEISRENTDSFDSTMADFHALFSAVTQAVMKRELRANLIQHFDKNSNTADGLLKLI